MSPRDIAIATEVGMIVLGLWVAMLARDTLREIEREQGRPAAFQESSSPRAR